MDSKSNKITLKVASNSQVKSLAGSISKSFDSSQNVELLAIGASAVNQAIKACAMARGFMSTKGYDLYVAPGFETVPIDGDEKTAIKLVLKLI